MKKKRTKLKTLVLDPSPTQRLLLTHLVQKQQELELLGTYDHPAKAYNHLGKIGADLLILEVELPLINGLDFLETLDEDTQVILTSSTARYALEAFDHGVTDYLLKPLNPERFRKAVEKAVVTFIHSFKPLKKEMLVVRCDLQQREINTAQIMWIEAMGDYVKLVTPAERVVVLSTMKGMLRKLPQDRFLRIHRSYIVNLDMVNRYNSTSVDIRGKTLPMSRRRKPLLERKLYPLS